MKAKTKSQSNIPTEEQAENSGEGIRQETGLTQYANAPERFAREVLGSHWWTAQRDIARALAANRRVAVKAANGVGKTFLAADLVLWFLYTQPDSLVLTTAPTWRQVESLLWEEIRKRHRQVNARAEQGLSPWKLEGRVLQTGLKICEGHFALGLSTDEPVRFQGFHAANLLVVLDEACGVPEEIWDAVEGICVGRNNRVLAISNPLAPTGRFYGLFKSARWKTLTISALAHPNVTGRGRPDRTDIPGAVTREAVQDRIEEWCEQVNDVQAKPEASEDAAPSPAAASETFRWQGGVYRPNGLFRARVLGEFPEAGDDSLFALTWIEAAMRPHVGIENEETARTASEKANENAPLPCILAVDVARFGSDETVFALRRGSRVFDLITLRGQDTMAVAGRVLALARAERATLVLVDEVGVGGGVVDRLREEQLAGVVGVQFGGRPDTPRACDLYLNQRAQTYWNLREALRRGEVQLPDDRVLSEQLANLRYEYTSAGQVQIESKAEMRRRGLPSPDRADAVAMLFGPSANPGRAQSASLPLPRQRDGADVAHSVHWNEVATW